MRCFIAAWPSDDTRSALHRLIVGLKDRVPHGRAMQARNLHLTLAFIGELEPERAQALGRGCDELADDVFEWTIDTVGSFPRARVAWAGGPVDRRLADCVAHARGRLDELGITYDPRPFVPHVTLYRDARRFEAGGPLEPPLRWSTDHVALYAAERDRDGPLYRRVVAAERA
jgi:2'-5' RNA ligase